MFTLFGSLINHINLAEILLSHLEKTKIVDPLKFKAIISKYQKNTQIKADSDFARILFVFGLIHPTFVIPDILGDIAPKNLISQRIATSKRKMIATVRRQDISHTPLSFVTLGIYLEPGCEAYKQIQQALIKRLDYAIGDGVQRALALHYLQSIYFFL